MSKPRAAELVARMNGLSAPPAPAPLAPAMEIPEPVIRVRKDGARSGGGRRRRSSATGAIRYTIDLDVDVRRRLTLAALDHRTDASEVIRALIELLDDQLVARRVAEHLEGANHGG